MNRCLENSEQEAMSRTLVGDKRTGRKIKAGKVIQSQVMELPKAVLFVFTCVGKGTHLEDFKHRSEMIKPAF